MQQAIIRDQQCHLLQLMKIHLSDLNSPGMKKKKKIDYFAILSKILKGPCINCAGIRTQGFLVHSLDIVFYLASPILNFPPFLCLFFSKDATNRFFRQKMSFVKKISVWFRSIEIFFSEFPGKIKARSWNDETN